MADQENAPVDASTGSSPSKITTAAKPPNTSTRAPVASKFQMRTEVPTLPRESVIAFVPSAVDDKSAGNFDFTTELLEKGFIGYWRRRSDASYSPVPVEIYPAVYYSGIRDTLAASLSRLFQLKTQLPGDTIVDRIDTTAHTLACGCCLMSYLKVRNLVTTELPTRHASISLRKPRVSDQLALPTGFAFAIQQLGIVNVADSVREQIYVPCFPEAGHTSGIPTEHAPLWNPNAYAQAVEYARSLGMTFAMVDLKKKDGTAWWLFRQAYADQVFELICSLPEVNFTPAMAITHALFLNGNAADPSRLFVNLEPLGAETYGIMMRTPHTGINVSSYEAISQEAQEVVSNV